MSYYFIINPGSRHHRAARFIPFLFSELKKRKIEYAFKLTANLEDAHSISRAANEQGYEVVAAIGGDGTINKVLNGFYDASGKRISQARLGVIHTGTSPDFCKSYGIPVQPALALQTLLRGHSKQISVARIDHHSRSGEQKTGYFACCASLGVGARVAQRSNSGLRKYLGDSLGTFCSILLSLCRYQASDLHLICDGEKRLVKGNFDTFIGKTKYIASGLKVRHSLREDDERLYLLSVQGLNPLNLIPVLKAVYSGSTIPNSKCLSFSYARTIEVLAGESNQELEFDGDPQGFLPCRISIATDKLELIANEP